MRRLLFLTLLLAISPLRSAYAADDKKDHIDINPLVTFSEQLQELEEECANKPYDRSCDERREEIKDNIKKLRQICRKNPNDDRCESLAPHRKEVVSTIEFYCRQNPHEPRCVRRRVHQRQHLKKLGKFCAKNPDSKRCQVKVQNPRGKTAMSEYCATFPEKLRCVKWKEKQAQKRPVEDDSTPNTF